MVLKKDGEDQLDRSCEKMKECYKESRRRGISYIHSSEGRLTGMVTLRMNCLRGNTLLKEDGRKDGN